MKQQHIDYKLVSNPKIWRWFAAAFRSTQHTPMMHGLIEVDVTRARAFLRKHKAKTGESLSFTAFLIACLAKAVEENKAVQALRKGNKHLVIFKDVDVYTLIERNGAGQKQIIPYTIREANCKTVHELHHEIRAAQVEDIEKVLTGLQFLPDFLFGLFFWGFSSIGRRHPQVWVQYVGTEGITAVGIFGKGAGWGIPPALPTLMMTVGGISEKPVFIDGQIVTRDYLNLTISFDHDIIDGAPAVRFTERLKGLIESGYGLFDATIAPKQAPLSRG
jgi:pyruvate/2-oxoglutarate dehydrogenase complex dihydrolipoamide acyltransferase (E2) component